MRVVRIVVVAAVAVAALALAGWVFDQPTRKPTPAVAQAPRVHSITYEVTGTAKSASMTYEHPQGSSQVGPVRLPWRLSFEAEPGQFLYLSAQNQGEHGSVVTAIYIDGELFRASESKGSFVNATVSDYIPHP